MLDRPRTALALAISISIAALIVPVPAGAKVFNEFLRLSQRNLSPAPLVPVSAPPKLTPLDQHIGQIGSRKKGSYLFRMTAAPGKLLRPDTVVAFERGFYPSMSAARRGAKRSGFRARKTKVRGHNGYLFTRVIGGRLWDLTWLEEGKVHSISTGTTKTISLKQLRTTADALEHLGREYIGSTYDRDTGGQSAIVVPTDKTVAATIDFGARCTTADGTQVSPSAGHLELAFAPRQGSSFSYALTPGSPADNAWTLSGTGTITPDATTLNYRATGLIDGHNCDSGPVALTLDQRAQG